MHYLVHDYDKARKQAGEGKIPVLLFSGGDKKALLPTGQLVNVGQPKRNRGRGKEWRRVMIKARREAREKVAV
jgi:hypothetical protein